MPTAAIATLGCKVNQAESEMIADDLAGAGFAMADFGDIADVYVVNSCTVTAEADHKSRRLARAALRTNPSALVVLAGCYASEASNRPARLPQQIMLVPSERKHAIGNLIAQRLGSGKRASAGSRQGTGTRTRAMVKVTDGCDNRCAYCVVPLARGPARSVPVGDVLARIERLAGAGVAEIVLTGINLGSYRSDGLGLPGLLSKILEIPVGRVRLSSIEPQDVTDSLVDVIRTHERICPHLHVPLQSGSDRVLSRMGRRYDAAQYRSIARRLASARSSMALTTDAIVGFPGESDADFAATIDLLEQVVPLKVHAFRFSPRPGTKAASLPGQIEASVKAARARALAAVESELGNRFVSDLVGQARPVVVETARDGVAQGLADNYVRYTFKGGRHLQGTIVNVIGRRLTGRVMHGALAAED